MRLCAMLQKIENYGKLTMFLISVFIVIVVLMPFVWESSALTISILPKMEVAFSCIFNMFL
jgi:hypothetical protein